MNEISDNYQYKNDIVIAIMGMCIGALLMIMKPILIFLLSGVSVISNPDLETQMMGNADWIGSLVGFGGALMFIIFSTYLFYVVSRGENVKC